MIEKFFVLIPQMIPCDFELVGYKVPIALCASCHVASVVDKLCHKGRSHILSVKPHLVGVALLMPHTATGILKLRVLYRVFPDVGLKTFHGSINGKLCLYEGGIITERGIGSPLLRKFIDREVYLCRVEVVEASSLFWHLVVI